MCVTECESDKLYMLVRDLSQCYSYHQLPTEHYQAQLDRCM